VCVSLNWKYSEKYSTSAAFRQRFLNLICRPHKQLSLKCSNSNITNLSALSGMHALDLGYCDNITDVSALSSVHTLDLDYCNGITDVSALGSVYTLRLS
jgi:hypothetical protein